jgi:hypothetical protein
MKLLAEDLEIEVGCRAMGFEDDRLATLGLLLLSWRRHLDCLRWKVKCGGMALLKGGRREDEVDCTESYLSR